MAALLTRGTARRPGELGLSIILAQVGHLVLTKEGQGVRTTSQHLNPEALVPVSADTGSASLFLRPGPLCHTLAPRFPPTFAATTAKVSREVRRGQDTAPGDDSPGTPRSSLLSCKRPLFQRRGGVGLRDLAGRKVQEKGPVLHEDSDSMGPACGRAGRGPGQAQVYKW